MADLKSFPLSLNTDRTPTVYSSMSRHSGWIWVKESRLMLNMVSLTLEKVMSHWSLVKLLSGDMTTS